MEDRGTFSLRGDILDLFPPTGSRPVRIEFFGDWIERMRPFDPAGQRTGGEELTELFLLPAREMILAGAHLDTFARRLKERCDALEIGRQQREAVIEEAREGLLAPGALFLLPFNYERPRHLLRLCARTASGRFSIRRRWSRRRTASPARSARESGAPPAAANRMRPLPTCIWNRRQLEAELRRHRRIDFAGLQVYRLEADRQIFRFRAEGNGDLRADTRQEDAGMPQLAGRLRQWRQARLADAARLPSARPGRAPARSSRPL